MRRPVPLWSVALVSLVFAGVVVAQGSQPNFIRNLFSPIISGGMTVTGPSTIGDLNVRGDAGVSGYTTLQRAVYVDNVVTDGGARICLTGTGACTTNYLAGDTFGSINGTGPWAFNNNIAVGGTSQATGYFLAAGGIKNSGTAAPCSGNTGAVCIDDPSGLAISDGSQTTVATVDSLGNGALFSLTLGGIAVTPPFDFILNSASLALTGTPVVQEFGAMASASTITSATFTPGIVGIGAGNYVAKLCSDSACAATTYVTCTVTCTGAVGTPVACTINTAAVAMAADPFYKITTACAPSPQGVFVAHLKQP